MMTMPRPMLKIPNIPMMFAMFVRFVGERKRGFDDGRDHAQHDEQDENAEFFFHF